MKWCVWFCFIFSQTLWALPKEVEIWFLSEPKNMVKLQRWLDQLAATKFSRLTATNVNEHGSCQKMGEGFFHPQFGLHEHYGTENGIMANPIDYNMQDDVLSELDFVSNNEVDLINCDPNYQFDLFCGKAQDQIKNKSFDLEIWVDTSSSFIRIDRKDRRGDCYRKSFVKRVLNGCATKNVGVSVFDEHKKNNPELSGLCDSIGSNNQERLIKWIKKIGRAHV